MLRPIRAAAIVLVFIAIVSRPAVAEPPPIPQFLMDEVVPPSNDDSDSATVVTALPFDDTIDTRAASGAADDPICGGGCATVWYRYTPEQATSIGGSTWGSDYGPIVFVYTGERGALKWISDLSDFSYRLALDAGTTYHFMVMSMTRALVGGRLHFSLTDRPPLSLGLVVEPVAFMDKQSGVITLRGEVTCSMPAQIVLSFTLRRLLAQRILLALGSLFLACADHAHFEVAIQTYSASRFGDYFPPGHYVASISATGVDDLRHEPADVSLYPLPLLIRGAP